MSERNLQRAATFDSNGDITTKRDVTVGRNLIVNGTTTHTGSVTFDDITVTGVSTQGVINCGEITSTGDVNCVNVVASGNVDGVDGNFSGDISAVDGNFTGDVDAIDINADPTTGLLTGYNLVLTDDVTNGTVTGVQVSGDINPGTGTPPANIYQTGLTLSYQKKGNIVYLTIPSSSAFVIGSAPTQAFTLYLSKADNSVLFATHTDSKLQPPTNNFNNVCCLCSIGGTLRSCAILYTNTYNLRIDSIGGSWNADGVTNNQFFTAIMPYICAI